MKGVGASLLEIPGKPVRCSMDLLTWSGSNGSMDENRSCAKKTQIGSVGSSANPIARSIRTSIWSSAFIKTSPLEFFYEWLSHGFLDLVHLWTDEAYPESVTASAGLQLAGWPREPRYRRRRGYLSEGISLYL